MQEWETEEISSLRSVDLKIGLSSIRRRERTSVCSRFSIAVAASFSEVERRQPVSDELRFYGFPEECRRFEERHPEFHPRFSHLVDAFNLAFTRIIPNATSEDKFIYFFGRMCLEDFFEIFLVSVHGYGAAACKLVRSMYEHTVTLHYLSLNPEEIKAFIEYHHIEKSKLMDRITETFGEDVFCDETRTRIHSKAGAVRPNFTVPGTNRVFTSWNKLDFVSMAKKAGEIGQLIVPGYFFPLQHAHSSFGGLTQRLEMNEEHMAFNQDAQPELVDESLITAHNCVLDVVRVQNETFKIPRLDEALNVCYEDFGCVWKPEAKSDAAGG